MEKVNILLVNQDSKTLSSMWLELSEYGYKVDQTNSVEEAIALVQQRYFDVIITDTDFKTKKKGINLVTEVRKQEKLPYIIIYSAEVEAANKIKLLKAGADVFVDRPAIPKVLKAQIIAFTRRAEETQQEISRINVAKYKEIEADRERRSIAIDGKHIAMSDKEYRIIRMLMRAEGKPVSKEDIMIRVWGYFEDHNRVVDVYIAKIRSKIGQDKILTIRGKGYMLY